MTELDGEIIWVRKLSDLPAILGLGRVDPANFTRMRRCDGANSDVEILTAENEKFVSISMKMLVGLNNFADPEKSPPTPFYLPSGDLRVVGGLIYRAPQEFFSGNTVYEALLLPCKDGLVIGAFWKRKLGAFIPELQALINHRILCWYRNYPSAPPARGVG